MNDAQYHAWLDTLDKDQREIVQKMMSRINTILNADRRHTIDDIQRVERRQATNSERIGDLHVRLDQYEQSAWTAAKQAIEEFAAARLSIEEVEKFFDAFRQLVIDVEELKTRTSTTETNEHERGAE